MNAAGDQFFLPDNSRFYFDDLQGEKHLRYVPNAKHDLARERRAGHDPGVLPRRARPAAAAAVHLAHARGRDDRRHRAGSSERGPPVAGEQPGRRDFRLDVIGKAWTSTVLQSTVPGEFRAAFPAPARGYTAFFVELTYGARGDGWRRRSAVAAGRRSPRRGIEPGAQADDDRQRGPEALALHTGHRESHGPVAGWPVTRARLRMP